MVSPRLLRRRHAARLGHESGVPDRFHLAKLVGPVRRRRRRARRARRWTRVDERLVRRDSRADPAPRSALRQIGTRIPATSKATCPACARTAASTPSGASGPSMAFAALGDSERAWELFSLINPVNHALTPARRGDLQSRAVRGRRRRLRRLAAHRPRRLDLVHGLGRLDVPADRRIAAGPAAGGGQAALRAVPARALGVFKIHYRYRETFITPWYRAHRRRPKERRTKISVTVDGTAQSRRARCRSSTTTRNTPSR